MQELRQYAKEFTYEDKHYTIKVFSNDDRKYIVRAYLNDEPANGYEYGVDLNVRFACDVKYGIGTALSSLIESAVEDVENKTWDKLINKLNK